MSRKFLLACGILSSVLYLAMNVVVPLQWEGYDSASMTVSELSAIGAPTRMLWVLPCILYSVLAAAFGFGVWASARGKRSLRIVGALMVAYGVTGLAWHFAPMHLRGAERTMTDTLHIAMTFVTALVYLPAPVFAAAAFGWRFRIYSIATLAVIVASGVVCGMDGPRIAANLPTPWVGVWERILLGAFHLWVVALAIVILRPLLRNRAARVSATKAAMTLGGIGPRLALLSLPYVVLSVVVMLRDPGFLNMAFLDSVPFQVAGFAWLGAGLAFWASSGVYFMKHFGAGKLITKGPFALCRNPIYASLIVFVIPSLAVLFHSGLVLSIAVVLYVGFKVSILGETILLRRAFGAEYEAYEKSVNELLPFPRFLFAGARERRPCEDARGLGAGA